MGAWVPCESCAEASEETEGEHSEEGEEGVQAHQETHGDELPGRGGGRGAGQLWRASTEPKPKQLNDKTTK